MVLTLNSLSTATGRKEKYIRVYSRALLSAPDKIILFHTSICSKVNPLGTRVSCDGYSVFPRRERSKTRSENIGFTYCTIRLLPAAFLRRRAFAIKVRLPFHRPQTRFLPFVSRCVTRGGFAPHSNVLYYKEYRELRCLNTSPPPSSKDYIKILLHNTKINILL